MKTERFAMAIDSYCLYAFIRPESEQNCSLGQINGALAPLTSVSLFASIGVGKLLNGVS
jgi:hypothetical protein